jgi:3-hydroxyisobutyrate dehydrogenase
MTKKRRIGIVGLGNTGRPILNNLRRAGRYSLTVCDADNEKLAALPADVRVAKTAREAAESSDAVVTCLPKPEHILEAVNGEEGLFAGAKSGMVWIDTSTTDFKQTRALAQTAQERGVCMLEATLTGGVRALQKNNMVCLGGGNAAAFEAWRPALQDAIGPVVVRCGDIGAGAIAKVASNMLAFVNMAAAAECLMLAKRAGLDIENFFDAIRASAGNSFAWETVVPHIFNRQYEAGFTMDLACKDMHLSYRLGRDLQVPLELHALVEQMMNRARLQYGEAEGCYVYPRALEDTAGESLAAAGWDKWEYDLGFVDGSVVVKHSNRPPSAHLQPNTEKRPGCDN